MEPIAAAPVREELSQGQRRGFANPTNILQKDSYYYTIIRANTYGNQRQGNCLFRAKQIDDVHSWTLFDGKAFVPSEADPYANSRGNSMPCAPLNLGGALGSIVQYGNSGLYLAVSEMRETDGRSGQILIATSRDLLHWSSAKSILKIPLANAHQCSDAYTYAYPSILDPTSHSVNFDTVSDNAVMFLTRIRMANCGLTPDRDIVRFAICLHPAT